MPSPRKFTVIDSNSFSASFLARALLQKFPLAVVQVCTDTGAATHVAATEQNDALVVHRTEELTGPELACTIRALTEAPLVAVAELDHAQESLDAGADVFLAKDDWLRVGETVATLLAKRQPAKRCSAA